MKTITALTPFIVFAGLVVAVVAEVVLPRNQTAEQPVDAVKPAIVPDRGEYLMPAPPKFAAGAAVKFTHSDFRLTVCYVIGIQSAKGLPDRHDEWLYRAKRHDDGKIILVTEDEITARHQ